MIPVIVANDAQSKKNVETVLALYDEMVNTKQATTAVQKYLHPDYIQHNPIVPTTSKSLGVFFEQVSAARKNLRVITYKVIASGDYVWAHVNFINLFNDESDDRGYAVVDIYRFNPDGKIAEHWDVIQEIPDPQKAANSNGMF